MGISIGKPSVTSVGLVATPGNASPIAPPALPLLPVVHVLVQHLAVDICLDLYPDRKMGSTTLARGAAGAK